MNSSIKLYTELLSSFKLKKGFTNEDIYSCLIKYDIKLIVTRFTSTQLIAKFIEIKQSEGLSKNTINSYTCTLHLFDKYLHNNDIGINDVTKNTIRSFIDYLSNIYSKGTVFHNISVIRVFFNYLHSEGILESNPCLGVSYKKPKVFIHALNKADVTKLKRACKNLRDKVLIEFLLDTGCRVSEVINIKKTDLNFNDNSCTVLGKGQKERVVLFTKHISKLLKSYMKTHNNEYLFVSSIKPYSKLDRFAINALVKRLSKKANILNIHPHMFRHTFATNALNKGMSIVSIQKLLGHDNISTTQIYAEINLDTVKKQYCELMN